MKTGEITTATTVYQCGRGETGPHYPAVVVDTGKWEGLTAHGRPAATQRTIVGYRRLVDPRVTYGDQIGMLAVRPTVTNTEWTTDELIQAGQVALAETTQSRLPELPKGYTLAVLRPQHVRRSWSSYELEIEKVREQRDRQREQRDRRAAVEAGARERLAKVLGTAMPQSPYPMTWVQLETVCEAYRQGMGPAI